MRPAMIVLFAIVFATPGLAAAEDRFAAERAFAYLMFGQYFQDPCDNISSGARQCPPRISERLLEFEDQKAEQTYRFEQNRCVVHADTRVLATGKTYHATFDLRNALYVNLKSKQQEGHEMEVEIFLQGAEVIRADGKARNVFVLIHKYYATDSGDIGHDVNIEVMDMRRALKKYQADYCADMG